MKRIDEIFARLLCVDASALVEAFDLEGEEIDDLIQTLEEGNWFVAVIPLETDDNENIILRLLSVAFKFPGYYGKNWNATDDLLRELPNTAYSGYVCVLISAAGLRAAKKSLYDDLVRTFEYAQEFWRRERLPFKLVAT